MGIIADLSEWQGTINFAQLSKVVDGVILRVQAGYTHPDSRYKEYVAGCKANNIPFGTYAYFKGISVPDAIAEAKSAFALTDKDSKCFALDIEELTCSDLVSAGQAFIDYLHNQGMKNVGLYSGAGFYNAHNLASIKADWHWIAAYGVNDGQAHKDPKIPNEDLWQFTSVGHLQGVNTNVDESKVTGNFTFFADQTVVTPIPAVGVQPFGTITVNYPSQYGVNVYESPNGTFKKRVPGGMIFSVYCEKDGFYDLGQSTWIEAQYAILKRDIVKVNYPSQYGVNVYDSPNGHFIKRVPGGMEFSVYACVNGWYDLGNSTWIDGQYVKKV